MSNLRGILTKELERSGVISFDRFMELALYCPNFGYYEREGRSPGRGGDYFTSVSTGSLFGELLARQFAGWLKSGPPGERVVLEAGAHYGRLAGDVLGWLKNHEPEVFLSMEYWILEPSARRRQVQEELLKEQAGRVRWFDDWNRLPRPGVRGVIFSNELLDAMPAHRLGWDANRKQWFEWGVALRGGEFVWKAMPEIRDAEARPVLPPELLAVLPDGFVTEKCPAAAGWWRQAARALRSGRLLTFDYGLEQEQFFSPERSAGTLRAYHRHRQSNDLLARAGGQDITAHVNFSAIRQVGEEEGLRTEDLTTQERFLTRVMEQAAKSGSADEILGPGQRRQFQTLTHPEHLGRRFQVLVQSR